MWDVPSTPAGPPLGGGDRTPDRVTTVLDGHRGSLTLHHRFIAVQGVHVLLDHILSSRGGAYLIQERADVTDVDAVRRSAEVLESLISRPVDPILVLPNDGRAGENGGLLRGVKVLAEKDFARWLASLPETTPRQEMVLINARAEKATDDWTRHRRIPDWEVRARMGTHGVLAQAPAHARRPAQRSPGPREWSPAENVAVTQNSRRSTALIVAGLILIVILAVWLTSP